MDLYFNLWALLAGVAIGAVIIWFMSNYTIIRHDPTCPWCFGDIEDGIHSCFGGDTFHCPDSNTVGHFKCGELNFHFFGKYYVSWRVK